MSKRVDPLVETLQAVGVMTWYGIVGDMLNRIAYAELLTTSSMYRPPRTHIRSQRSA